MRKENLLLTLVMISWRCFSIQASPAFDFSNTLQALESLGVPRTSMRDITVGKGKRTGDSAIYYIKLPSLPYIYANNQPQPILPMFPQRAVTTNPFHRVNVDFTNNGRPEQVYHWNYKPHVPIKRHPLKQIPFHSTDSLYVSHNAMMTPDINEIIRNSIVLPPGIPIMAEKKPVVAIRIEKPISNGLMNPFISLNRDFVYNGKPSGLYVWKPKPKPIKYRHHYFKHFNY